ncbi:MAG: Ig-like domain-containing protein [Oscillospiraceae bacterium]|nr:Ig-like domain-containing protein [Oscillospiraceae bacterium]
MKNFPSGRRVPPGKPGWTAVRICAAVVLAAAMLSLAPKPNGGDARAAREITVKDGYTLYPEGYSESGVDPGGAFILTTPEDARVEWVASALTIDGESAPAIEGKSAREFTVMPSARLLDDCLYTFRLQKPGGGEVTWVFQTAARFAVVSTLPSSQSTNVPADTGIEITFSTRDYKPIDKYFHISPNVSGRFEYHKETAVFVPKKLAYATVYTVTLKAGVERADGAETLGEDVVFSFETEADPKSGGKPAEPVEMYFGGQYTELPSTSAPSVAFYVYSGEKTSDTPAFDVSVYKFSGADDAADAVAKLQSTPYWSVYGRMADAIDASRLHRVTSLGSDGAYDERNGTLTFPDSLSQGFYLVEASAEGARAQMIIQISDLPVQVLDDGSRTLVWVNDMSTGKAASGATVRDIASGKTYTADESGVAVVDRAVSASSQTFERLDVAYGDKQCVWLHTQQGYGIYFAYDGMTPRYFGGVSEAYWSTLRLDRTLYKRDDTVSFWGFAKGRGGDGTIDSVTAVVTEGYYRPYARDAALGGRDVLQNMSVPVTNNSYSGEMELPRLEPGSYRLTLMYGEDVLGSAYFSVEDFVKPSYSIDVSTDKKAYFAGETVTFNIVAGFFEGTPVAELDISYYISGFQLQTDSGGSSKTDENGAVTVTQKASPQANAQGLADMWLQAEATLPEIGPTYVSAYADVFVNDIDVSANASRKAGRAALDVDIRAVTLDRINGGTAEGAYDYLGEPVSGKTVSAGIYRVYWTREETGEQYYDYIEKKSVARFRYDRHEEKIDDFTITTGADGKAEKSFSVPERDGECYLAKLSCKDGNGRVISRAVYIGEDYSERYNLYNSNQYYLDGADERVNIGDEISLTLMRGEDEVTSGGFLFVAMQRGVLDWEAGQGRYSFTFGAEHVPNVTVAAYYFDGYNYRSGYMMRKDIMFDYGINSLELTVETDKDSYRPGDMCTVTVTSAVPGGIPKGANINVSVVDEALFALDDYTHDTAGELYRALGAGLLLERATHSGGAAPYALEMAGGSASAEAAGAPPSAERGAADGGSAYLRELFKDTAYFNSARTGGDGKAAFTFKLPDNVTSWRLSVSGVSDDLFAGSETENIKVTQPMFINYSLGDTFLTGDKPVLGVSVYGAGVEPGETVSFDVEWDGFPDRTVHAEGAPFERVDIPLREFDGEGEYSLIISAAASGGASDSVRHTFTVRDSYRMIDVAEYYDVTEDTVFRSDGGGLTSITFIDRGRGQYLSALLDMRYVYGDRIERRSASREAARLISEYFPDIVLPAVSDFDPTSYQRPDGGVAMLPYASSDVWLTAMLLPYIGDELSRTPLSAYLNDALRNGGAGDRPAALYGLAQLGEPVLLELDAYSRLEDMTARDAVYLALGYEALGERVAAETLYGARVAPGLESIASYYRLNTGDDNDDILRATAAASILASKLGKPEKDGLYGYCVGNYARDELINLEKIAFISQEIGGKTGAGGSVTYTLYGREYTRELGVSGGQYTLRIPAAELGEFKLTRVAGQVGAVSLVSAPLNEVERIDEDIFVKRAYYRVNAPGSATTELERGDLVRVNLWVDYSKKAMDGAYCVTDYLPAGLEYVGESAKTGNGDEFGYEHRVYARYGGREVAFYDYNGRFDKGILYYYYARVISPGEFRAEGTLVQSVASSQFYAAASQFYAAAADSHITIK